VRGFCTTESEREIWRRRGRHGIGLTDSAIFELSSSPILTKKGKSPRGDGRTCRTGSSHSANLGGKLAGVDVVGELGEAGEFETINDFSVFHH